MPSDPDLRSMENVAAADLLKPPPDPPRCPTCGTIMTCRRVICIACLTLTDTETDCGPRLDDGDDCWDEPACDPLYSPQENNLPHTPR